MAAAVNGGKPWRRGVRICSIVRNGMGYLPRHFAQVERLEATLRVRDIPVQVWLCEGDSSDGTWEYLIAQAHVRPLRLFQYCHGGPAFGSVDNPTRWRNIARTWNYLFDQMRRDRWGHAVIYVEADLIWEPGTMLRLLGHLAAVDAVAPMSMRGDIFYDTWGHRAQNEHFTNFPPFHPLLEGWEGGLLRLESAGSCTVMRSAVADVCTFDERDAMLGQSMAAQGFGLWLDPGVRVEHP